MRPLCFVLVFLFSVQALAAPRELVVYAYDSFSAKGGLGPAIQPLFEKRCGCKLRILPSGDAAQLVTRLEIDAERAVPLAHVVLGLDQQTWPRAKSLVESWDESGKRWLPKGYDKLRAEAKLEQGFLAFDYGIFAFMMDRKRMGTRAVPKSLDDLLKPEFKRALILEDPRTSTPGLAFIRFAHASKGKEFSEYVKKLKPQWLTLAPGWSAGYGLFLKEQAPLVWSYVTSQAYHAEHDDPKGERYQALVFNEGQPYQVEGMALVRRAFKTDEERQLARDFLEFMISDEVQKLVPSKNWMMPARSGVELPASYKNLPKPKRLVAFKDDAQETLEQWSKALPR